MPEKNQTLTDYRTYRLSFWEWGQSLAVGFGVSGLAAYAFYRSTVVFILLLIPSLFLTPRYMRRFWKEQRQRRLQAQFKEAIQLLAASLSAGISVENAISSCGRELGMMYGSKGMISQEFAYMVRQMNMNRPIEELMDDFAKRTGLEEVETFARIFQIAKRSGGQLVPVICHTVQVMEDRFQVKEEIRTLTASRQFEQKVMNAMPFLMILYIDGTSPGFFEVMYTTLMGRIVMTACLAVYLISCWMSGRILNIQMAGEKGV